ncbi:MAG: 16S rRNA (cytidine(1402)-2'-O)-methyltransferase [Hyphomicrobiales bacterium]|nr:16S rRNA (cytidine(1402)-2'-O)-methyltransferase [Hyphomicrobiales bacterium]
MLIEGRRIAVMAPDPGLYVVATPIGNLGDVTLRALRILAGVDRIACEDTRITRRLTAHYGIETRLVAYHDHNADRVRPMLLARLARGESLALVSDAGTPLVSDPGFRLVAEAIAQGHALTVCPGPTAAISALILSGLPSDRFFFEGFLPAKRDARRKRIATLKDVPATLLFFESPRRLAASLGDLASVLGPRQAAVAREMTKRFEETRRAPLDELAAAYAAAPPPKGEIVVVVAPPGAATTPDEADIDALLGNLLATLSVRDAATVAAERTGLARKSLYARALRLAGAQGARR